MKTLIIIWAIAITAGLAFFAEVDYFTLPAHAQSDDKSCASSSCTNPERPYFDGCGNEYDYLGNLIHQGTGCQIQEVQPQSTISNSTEGFTGK